MLHALLALQQLPRWGRQSLCDWYCRIRAHELEIEEDVDAVHDLLQKTATPSLHLPSRADWRTAWATAAPARYAELGIVVLGKWMDAYPTRMKESPVAPVLLFAKGNMSALSAAEAVAIVGSRRCSAMGKVVAHRLGRFAAEEGMAVVSGLAVGADTAAHQGCVAGGGHTVAVLAHALDQPIYPRANVRLAAEIVAKGGVLLSEYPLATPMHRGRFVARNRWQVMLSDAVVVVESDVDGGAMHTAGFARAQNKPLGCVWLDSQSWQEIGRTKGNRKMLDEGAVPIRSRADLRTLRGRD